jgi:hypothetical protein
VRADGDGEAFLRRQIMCASNRSTHQFVIILRLIRKTDRSMRTGRGFEVADVDCGALPIYQIVFGIFQYESELTRYGFGPGISALMQCRAGSTDRRICALLSVDWQPWCALQAAGHVAEAAQQQR